MTFDLMETTEIHKVVQKSPPKTVQIVNKRWLLYLRESERETERQREYSENKNNCGEYLYGYFDFY